MIIGILSMQRIRNYGSFLQALSLKMQFEKLGHEVHFIDIEQGKQILPEEEKYVPENKILYYGKRLFNKEAVTKVKHYLFFNKMCKIHDGDYDKYLDNKNTERIKKSNEKNGKCQRSCHCD